MAVVVFCDNCRRQKDWPKPSIRVTTDACDICGGWDAYRTQKLDPRTRQPVVKVVKLKNFEQDERFLPGTAAETRLQEPLA
jgi:hypothetical protein